MSLEITNLNGDTITLNGCPYCQSEITQIRGEGYECSKCDAEWTTVYSELLWLALDWMGDPEYYRSFSDWKDVHDEFEVRYNE